MKNLTVRYYINLVSDIVRKSGENARAIEQAGKREARAMEQAEKAATKADKAIAAVGKTSSIGKIEGDARRATTSIERITAAAQRADAAMTRLGTGRSSFERMNSYLTGLGRRMEEVRRKASAMVEGIAKGARAADGLATGAVAGGAAAKAMAQRPMDFDLRLAALSNTAYADRDAKGRIAGIGELETVVNNAVRYGGGKRDSAVSALDTMLASGAFEKAQDAINLLPELQKNGTASGADPAELAQIAATAIQNFGMKPDEIPLALSKAIKAGQEGSFELKDMSKWLPKMMAVSSGMLGMQGMGGFEKLLQLSQLSAITAGSKDEAGGNLVNLLAKINSQDTIKDFEKVGIDLPASLAKAQKDGHLAPDAFVSFVEQVAMKDKKFASLRAQAAAAPDGEKKQLTAAMANIMQGTAIGQVVQDREALLALIGVMQNKDKGKALDTSIKNEQGGTTATNYEVIASRSGFAAEQAANEADITRSNVFKEIDGPLQSLLSGATGLAREFPLLTTALGGAVAAFGIWKAATLGSGLVGLLTGKDASGAGTAAKAAGAGFLGRAAPLLGKLGWLGAAGYAAYDVGSTLMDDGKTTAEKANAVGRTAAGVAGGWAGAKAGALAGGALGSVVPIVGTGVGAAVGGLIGGGLGWWGAQKIGDKLTGMDHPALQPTAALAAMKEAQPQKVEVDLKEGRLAIGVTVTDSRTMVNTSVVQQPNGVRIDAGSTNPAGR